jgi:hypothetical protein
VTGSRSRSRALKQPVERYLPFALRRQKSQVRVLPGAFPNFGSVERELRGTLNAAEDPLAALGTESVPASVRAVI